MRIAPREPHIWISICEPGAPETQIKENTSRIGLLRLRFHDTSRNKPGRIVFSKEQAEEVLRFVARYLDQVSLIVCQCEFGHSRSAGVARALSLILQKDDGWLRQLRRMPNRLMANVLLKTQEELKIL